MKRKIYIVDVIIIISLLLFIGCLLFPVLFPAKAEVGRIADENGDGQITLADYSGKRVGAITGVNYDQIVEDCIPGAIIEYYSSFPDLVIALKSGLVDAFIVDGPSLDAIMMEDPTIGRVPEPMSTWLMSFAFSEKSKIHGLRDQMNEFLKMSRENGVMTEIENIWFGKDDSVKVIPPLENLSAENGTVRVALETTYAPIVYVKEQKVVGYEADILYRFCEYYHYGLEFMDMQYDAVLPAVISGKCDIGASGLEYDEEHAESVSMSDPHMEADSSLAVPMSDLVGESFIEERGTLWERICSSIEKNLFHESRWKLIVQGIGTTCMITVLSALFGTLLAFGMCLLRRTQSYLANPLCDAYIRFFQGIPLVVLLMILFYVVFSSSNLKSVWVAVIGFALCFSANAAEIMQSGLSSIDRGQEEAALALGYTRTQAFFRFLFPQAAIRFLPVYRGGLVSLLNDTSVAGYIAVQDLTKMSDIVRSRSYEAFLPLILTTIIYFVLARFITMGVNALLKSLLPKRMNDAGKGKD